MIFTADINELIRRVIFLNKVSPKIPNIDELRQISIESPIIKLLEYNIKDSVENKINSFLHISQTGFIKGFGTVFNIASLVTKWKIAKNEKGKGKGILFIDLKNAYDMVDKDILMGLVDDLFGYYSIEATIINFLLMNDYREINGKIYKMSKGVPQGGILSPLLFNLYINSLLMEIDKNNLMAWAYADDLASFFNNLDELELLIDIISKWEKSHKMKVNKKKSAIILIKKKELI